ncbi:hypothetical protein, partial [Mesorhizobium sp. M0643]|uniref:hypothetical protein n=1 Tax=Mesorhizobium sp. M0643 TaxID=2956978 RepID=UPI003335B3FF
SQRHHRAMAARPSEQAPFSLQNFLQNLQHTIRVGNAATSPLRNHMTRSRRLCLIFELKHIIGK